MRKSLGSKVRKFANLEAAWAVIHRNGRSSNSTEVRSEIEGFAQEASSNLRSLSRQLALKTFRFGKAKGVPLPKVDSNGKPTGAIRPIVLAPIRSRIVQRAILNVLSDCTSLKPYFTNPTSFGGVRKPRKPDSWLETGVAGAIQAALKGIDDGATHVASADISAFFTRISKPSVRAKLEKAINDEELLLLYDQAVAVELQNLEQLREYKAAFPIEEIGVAQGSSLSPLLGNIYLADFDAAMNADGCICLRYIDDFIILGSSERAVNEKLEQAKSMLQKLGLELAIEKSSKVAKPVEAGFEFLGIEVCPGIIRPAKKARTKFLAVLKGDLADSIKQMRAYKHTRILDRQKSLVYTLKRVEGRAYAWRKQYWFCNDRDFFNNLNQDISTLLANYLGQYRTLRESHDSNGQRAILGMPDMRKSEREPFSYPKKRREK